MSRRRTAWLLTLVLLLELAVLCCACSHIACHHCTHGADCSICEYVRLGLRMAFIPVAAALMLIARMTRAPRCAILRAAVHLPTLIDRKVELND